MTEEKRCTVCGEAIPAESLRRVTCSVKCGKKRQLEQLKEATEKRAAERAAKSRDRTCLICGATFQSIYRTAKYCKDECKAKGFELVREMTRLRGDEARKERLRIRKLEGDKGKRHRKQEG